MPASWEELTPAEIAVGGGSLSDGSENGLSDTEDLEPVEFDSAMHTATIARQRIHSSSIVTNALDVRTRGTTGVVLAAERRRHMQPVAATMGAPEEGGSAAANAGAWETLFSTVSAPPWLAWLSRRVRETFVEISSRFQSPVALFDLKF